jgi:hypothetical protein
MAVEMVMRRRQRGADMVWTDVHKGTESPRVTSVPRRLALGVTMAAPHVVNVV